MEQGKCYTGGIHLLFLWKVFCARSENSKSVAQAGMPYCLLNFLPITINQTNTKPKYMKMNNTPQVAQHTPGPWNVGNKTPPKVERSCPLCHISHTWKSYRDLPEWVELKTEEIEAIPELVQALRLALKAIRVCHSIDCNNEEKSDARIKAENAANSALEKYEGR